MLKKLAIFALLIVCVIGISAQSGDNGFAVDTATIEQQPAVVPGLPAGIMMKPLHENLRTSMSSSVLSYPAGFREPRHYHKTSGHYMYILKGRINSPSGVLTPGMFIYAPPGERHGPFNVLEPSEALFFTDGPFDFILDDVK
jgi:quercetin dioxygenase-like cupin family protein